MTTEDLRRFEAEFAAMRDELGTPLLVVAFAGSVPAAEAACQAQSPLLASGGPRPLSDHAVPASGSHPLGT